MSSILSSSHHITGSPIVTHHIKSLNNCPGSLLLGETTFVLGQDSNFQSFVQALYPSVKNLSQLKNPNDARVKNSNDVQLKNSNDDHSLKDQMIKSHGKQTDSFEDQIERQLIKGAGMDRQKLQTIEQLNQLGGTVKVSEQDAHKLISQLMSRGRQIQSMVKSHGKGNTTSQIRLQFQQMALQSKYLKFASQLVLTDYYKQRRLGTRLRGLNQDLIQQIEVRLFPLVQNQFKLWLSKRQTTDIQASFLTQVRKFKQQLNNASVAR